MTVLTRRAFWQRLAAAAAACGLAVVPRRSRFGPLTVDGHRALMHRGVHVHVFYQGRDVTRRCTFADDTGEGMAVLLLHNAQGKPYLVNRHFEHWAVPAHLRPRLATETVYGVTLAAGAPLI